MPHHQKVKDLTKAWKISKTGKKEDELGRNVKEVDWKSGTKTQTLKMLTE